MSFLTTIWDVLFHNILSQPAIFIGLIVLLGYFLLKKKWYEILAGFIRTVVGYMILQAGAGLLKGTVMPLLNGIQQKWEIHAVVIDPNIGFAAANSALDSIGVTTSYAMTTLLIAFIWNIVLVLLRKYTKIRTLFTTGHIMVTQSAIPTWFVFMMVPSLRNIYGILLIGILIGTYWAVFSNLTVEATQDLTDNSGFAIGHQQMLGVWFAYRFGGFLGKHKQESKKHKKLELGGAMSMLNDYVVSTTLLMLLFFGIVMVIIGPDILRKLDGANFPSGLSFAVYIFQRCASFAVDLVILKTGIRMFVNEMVESFNGISNSVLKGSLPAVDCAATYSFGDPNAVTLGFLFGAIGQLIAIIGLLIFKSPLMIIPGFVPLFYDNATIGLFANLKGGFKALGICCIGSGIIQILGSAGAILLFHMTSYGGYVGNFDWATIWPFIGLAVKYLTIPGILLSVIAMLLIPQFQYRNNKEHYFTLGTEDEEC